MLNLKKHKRNKMKLTKSKLKEMIREELLKESQPIPELEYSFSKTSDFRKAVKAVYKIENALYDKFLAHVKKTGYDQGGSDEDMTWNNIKNSLPSEY